MNTQFEIRNAPQHPNARASISGVSVTSSGLIRSTLGAMAAAGAILILAWLPAEYGIDPTGVGRLLGLTEMGEIKAQLAAEDATDAVAAAAITPASDPQILTRLTAIEGQLAGIAAAMGVSAEPAPAEAVSAATAAQPAAPVWRDEVSYDLPPGEGVEIKLVMQAGETASFAWSVDGGVVNYDTHGDDGGANNISYEKGRAVAEQAGTLTAAFTGNHGWFWRNRSDAPLTLTLRTGGSYAEMKAP